MCHSKKAPWMWSMTPNALILGDNNPFSFLKSKGTFTSKASAIFRKRIW